MRQVTLRRATTSDQGTFGQLYIDGGPLFCHTAELPYRGNKTSKSCIPTGTYTCTPRYSKKYKNHYIVNDVPDRSYILFHKGNFVGDTAKGYKTNSYGCILLGMRRGKLMYNEKMQNVVLASSSAMNLFLSEMGNADFTLNILEG